jgi:RNA polymerase sigma factor (sigma-70 family)
MSAMPKTAYAAKARFRRLLALSDAAYLLAVRVLGRREGAEDAVQQAYLDAWRHLQRSAPPQDERAWFLRAVANAAKMSVRGEARLKRREAAVRRERIVESPPDPELVAALRREVNRLEEPHRVAVSLCCEQGLSQREAALVLDLPESTVSLRVNTGLDRLRQALSRAGYAAAPAAVLGGLKFTAEAAPASVVRTASRVPVTSAPAPASGLAGLTAAWKVAAAFGLAVILAGGSALAVRGPGGAAPLPAAAPEPAPDPSSYGPVLDNNSLWRTFEARAYARVRTADGKLESRQVNWYWGGLFAKAVAPASTPPPPADWAGADFDDSCWPRYRLPLVGGCGAPRFNYETGLITVRGSFEVKDPTLVKDLKLSLAYYGGAAVHLNGKEVARGNLPGDKPDLEALAEDYPADAVTTSDGKALGGGDQKNKDRLALRERKLTDVKIPCASLRKGTNVLAIEIHAAATPEILFKLTQGIGMGGNSCGWPPIALLSARLTASPAAAVTPSLARPEGIQVWNCPPWQTVSVFDYGNPADRLRPMTISAARNSIFSGRLVISSGQAIKGLKVTVTDLAGEAGAKIPASAVRVRCAAPTVPALQTNYNWVPPDRFDGLPDAIPSEVPVNANKAGPPAGQNLAAGALAPLWVTVRVPKEAKPGTYEGTVSIAADGLTPTAVPLKLTVHDWVLPDPADFRTSVCGYELPESLAGYYNVPLWSDRHWELIGKSLALMAELNSRQVLVNLSVNWYGTDGVGGNQESEVRWIKQPDLPGEASAKTGGSPSTGSGPAGFKHDFSIFDKHLDAVAKSIGKPRPLRLNCWVSESGPFKNWGDEKTLRDYGGYVTTLDPATGKLDRMVQPCPGTEESLKFWKPVLDEIRKKVEARGWWDTTCVGHNHPYGPIHPPIVDVYRKIWSDGAWATTAHGVTIATTYPGTDKSLPPMRCISVESVWTVGAPTARGYRGLLDPKRPKAAWYGGRHGPVNIEPLDTIRWAHERHTLQGLDGTQFGADIFPRKGAGGRLDFEACNRGDLGPVAQGTTAILAPGADGPIVTERFEMFREGQELTEAVIFLERALQEKKISGELAERVNKFLAVRSDAMVRGWFGYTDLAVQDGKLLALAGEVAAAAK